MEDEKSVLRWGGLAGILAGIFFILGVGILIAVVPPAPANPEGLVMGFPDVRAALTVGNTLYLVGVILIVPLFLALYRTLRKASPAAALFGSVLGVLGLVVRAAAAFPQVAFTPISDLYHAPGATPEEQATLVLLWQATQGIFSAFDAVGLLIMPIGFIVLGVAMLRSPHFGKGFGRVSMVFGVVGVVSASSILIDPLSPIFLVGIITSVIFVFLYGRKVYSLSRAA